MKNRKNIFSIFLAILLVVGIMPMTVSAMQVFVYISIEDSTITLNVEAADSIENVKQKIQDKEGISPDTINLFFNGTLLNDGRTLGDYNIKNEDTIQVKLKHSHCVCGGTTNIGDHTTHDDIEFIPWDKTDSMPNTTGNYVLMNDVTISSGWKPAEGETVLCLNGYDLVYDGENTGSTIQFEQNRTLTLCDCNGIGKITHAESSYGRGVNVGGLNSLFIMYGGNICGNNARGDAGGGVQVALNMIMYGGTISDNVSNFQGGGVDIGFVGTLTMYGGTIESNSTSGSGGGVHVSGDDLNTGTFIMLGGSVTDNAAQKGGGVMLSAGDDYYANITVGGSAVIKNNTADTKPNNLYLHYSEGRQEQQLVTIQAMTDGAEIGITMDSGKESVFSTGGKDYTSRFFSDNGAYAVAVDGENLKLVGAYVQIGQVTLKNDEYTTDGRSATTTKPESGGYAYFKDGVLTLNNFTYSGGGGNVSVIYATTDLTINAVGNNTIDSTEKYAVHLKGGNLTITGDVLNLTVSNSANADMTVLLYDSANYTYGSMNLSGVTLNVQYAEVSERKTYGISCGNVIIDNTALTVDRHVSEGAMICSDGGLRSYGTVEIKNNSRVIIALSDGVESTGLRVEDANISISDSYVELCGSGDCGIGLAFDTSNNTLDFNSGTLIISGAHNTDGAAYLYDATFELPVGNYWWRTNENDSYTNGTYTYSINHTYIELTTAEPHDYVYSVEHNTITESCTLCDHIATATIKTDFQSSATEYKAKVVYSDNWAGTRSAELVYYKNGLDAENIVTECTGVGNYYTTLTVEGVTATLHYVVIGAGQDGKDGQDGMDGREVEFRKTETHIQWKYTTEDDTAWRDLVALSEITGAAGSNGTPGTNGTPGLDGDDGREIELQIGTDGKTLQWRYENGTWADLFDLSTLKGADGTNGTNGEDGKDGREIELRTDSGYIQWRYVGDAEWKNLVSLDTLKGEKGEAGADGKDGIDGANGTDGVNGENGLTPHIGENGNWWIGDSDTGVNATVKDDEDGVDGVTVAAITIGSLALLGNLGWGVFFLGKKKKWF